MPHKRLLCITTLTSCTYTFSLFNTVSPVISSIHLFLSSILFPKTLRFDIPLSWVATFHAHAAVNKHNKWMFLFEFLSWNSQYYNIIIFLIKQVLLLLMTAQTYHPVCGLVSSVVKQKLMYSKTSSNSHLYSGVTCMTVSYTHLDVYKRQAMQGSFTLKE